MALGLHRKNAKFQRSQIYQPTIGEELEVVHEDHKIKTHPLDNTRRRTLKLCRNDTESWGFTIQSYGVHHKHTAEVEMMTYVDYVEINGPAYASGLRAGDVMLSINGISMETADHTTLVNYIQTSGETMRIVVLFDNCQKKVEMHLRYIKLKKVMAAKEMELKSIEAQMARMLQGPSGVNSRRPSLTSSSSISSSLDDGTSSLRHETDTTPLPSPHSPFFQVPTTRNCAHVGGLPPTSPVRPVSPATIVDNYFGHLSPPACARRPSSPLNSSWELKSPLHCCAESVEDSTSMCCHCQANGGAISKILPRYRPCECPCVCHLDHPDSTKDAHINDINDIELIIPEHSPKPRLQLSQVPCHLNDTVPNTKTSIQLLCGTDSSHIAGNEALSSSFLNPSVNTNYNSLPVPSSKKTSSSSSLSHKIHDDSGITQGKRLTSSTTSLSLNIKLLRPAKDRILLRPAKSEEFLWTTPYSSLDRRRLKNRSTASTPQSEINLQQALMRNSSRSSSRSYRGSFRHSISPSSGDLYHESSNFVVTEENSRQPAEPELRRLVIGSLDLRSPYNDQLSQPKYKNNLDPPKFYVTLHDDLSKTSQDMVVDDDCGVVPFDSVASSNCDVSLKEIGNQIQELCMRASDPCGNDSEVGMSEQLKHIEERMDCSELDTSNNNIKSAPMRVDKCGEETRQSTRSSCPSENDGVTKPNIRPGDNGVVYPLSVHSDQTDSVQNVQTSIKRQNTTVPQSLMQVPRKRSHYNRTSSNTSHNCIDKMDYLQPYIVQRNARSRSLSSDTRRNTAPNQVMTISENRNGCKRPNSLSSGHFYQNDSYSSTGSATYSGCSSPESVCDNSVDKGRTGPRSQIRSPVPVPNNKTSVIAWIKNKLQRNLYNEEMRYNGDVYIKNEEEETTRL